MRISFALGLSLLLGSSSPAAVVVLANFTPDEITCTVSESGKKPQAITLASKVRALLDGRFHVSFKDIKEVVVPAMRHRVILNFEGEAEGITTDDVIQKPLAAVPLPLEEAAAKVRA